MQAIEHGKSVVVAVEPENCVALRKLLEPWLSDGQRRIVLDFTNVTFINSVNIAQIVALRHRSGPQGAEIRVANLQDNIRAVFRILRLDKIFSLDLTLEAALA
jgi:anti-sigma B factor antagonist